MLLQFFYHYFPFHFPQIGRFFGAIDPILMRNLVNSSLFTFKKTFDYQSLCDPKKESKAAAGLRSVQVVSYTSQGQFAHLPWTHKATHFCTPALIYPHILISAPRQMQGHMQPFGAYLLLNGQSHTKFHSPGNHKSG